MPSILLRVTAPKLRPDDLLDRLVLTSLRLPRRHPHRRAGAAPAAGPAAAGIPGPLPVHAKLAAYGLTGDGTGLPPDDKVVIDVADFNTARTPRPR